MFSQYIYNVCSTIFVWLSAVLVRHTHTHTHTQHARYLLLVQHESNGKCEKTLDMEFQGNLFPTPKTCTAVFQTLQQQLEVCNFTFLFLREYEIPILFWSASFRYDNGLSETQQALLSKLELKYHLDFVKKKRCKKNIKECWFIAK